MCIYIYIYVIMCVIMCCTYVYQAKYVLCVCLRVPVEYHAMSCTFQHLFALTMETGKTPWHHTTQVAYTWGRRTQRSRHGTKPLQARRQQWKWLL